MQAPHRLAGASGRHPQPHHRGTRRARADPCGNRVFAAGEMCGVRLEEEREETRMSVCTEQLFSGDY